MTTTDYLADMRACAEAINLGVTEFVLPEDRWVDLNGLRFHYLDWGNETKPPLVLLHGGSLTAHTWDMAALMLRQHYHLIALDQRGHGDTGWTPEAQFGEDNDEVMLRDTEAFIDHLGYDRIILCGMSMGGINAFRYASRHADRLRALIIVDVAPVLMQEGQVDMAKFRQETETLSRFDDFLERAVKFAPQRKPAHLKYSLLHALKQVPEGWTWKQDRRQRPGAPTGDAALAVRAERNARLWDDVRAIPTPTLLMRGGISRILSMESADATAKEMADCETVEIPNAGHTVQGDNPADFARELDAFVAKRLGPGR